MWLNVSVVQDELHKPVMQKEVIYFLDPKPNENFIDATIDGGGHARIILEKIKPNGKVLGIEQDESIIPFIPENDNLIIENNNYIHMKSIIKKYGIQPIKGILFDLGLSSFHVERSQRGFSFKKNEPLDMRFSKDIDMMAADIVNSSDYQTIKTILKTYGEEQFAPQIAKAICHARKKGNIQTTFDLVDIIKEAVPQWYKRKKIYFATKTFQALRIKVNKELENLRQGLQAACHVVGKGGRVVVISFHSLEHRIVKETFKEYEKNAFGKIITKHAKRPTRSEVMINARARSALLRVWERL